MKILICCLLHLALSVSVCAELPKEYLPFQKLLGTWKGVCKLDVTSKDGKSVIEFDHTSEYIYSEEDLAIILICSDTSRTEGKTIKTRYIIIWDTPSQQYKVMATIRGSGARLYTAKVDSDGIHLDNIDKPKGATFRSVRKLNKKGELCEFGMRYTPGEDEVTFEWSNKYKKVTR